MNLKRLLTPYQTPFTKVRMGRNADGGYVLLDEITTLTSAVYSYGIGTETSCEETFADRGMTVWMYDHTIDALPFSHPNFIFHKEPFDETFMRDVREAGKTNSDRIVLKIDVEGAEYDGLLLCPDPFWDHFAQIVIELHGLTSDNKAAGYLLIRLTQHYHVIHLHANNYGAINDGLPNTLEVTLLRKDFPINCQETAPYPIPGLDFPNCGLEDMKLDWWSAESPQG